MRGVLAMGLALTLLAWMPAAASAGPLDGVLESLSAAAAREAASSAAPVSNAPQVADATPEEALETRDLDALSAFLDRHEAKMARLAAASTLSAPRP